MGGSHDWNRSDVMPFGRPLPAMLECLPTAMRAGVNPRFQTTSWTVVLAASSVASSEDANAALTHLCQTYWHPVYAFIRRRGYGREQAEDLTQGFFAQLLAKHYLLDADRERGRFRSFLLTAVKHFLANEWDRSNALKRGGGQAAVSLDLVDAERWYEPATVEATTPEHLFERRWALSLLEQVMAKLRAEFDDAGKAGQFDALVVFLNRSPGDDRYQAVAERLGVSSGALRMSVHRLRRRYRELLRAEIAGTVDNAEQIDDEIRFLLATLSGR
jgi:DNA-directed RNA polymerase specialized sigma24 family protein